MAAERANFEWTEFTGGEWGPIAQGKSQDPLYAKAMASSLNGYPIEEGPWARRSGTMFLAPTHKRNYARLIGFDGSPTCSFAMEFTDTNLRFLTQSSLVFDNIPYTILTSDSGTGALTFTGVTSTWVAFDDIMFFFPDATSDLYPYPQALEVGLRRQVMQVGSFSDDGTTTTFTILDDRGAAIDTSAWPSGALVGAQVMRIVRLTTPYTGINQVSKLRAVQAETQSVILSNAYLPQVVQITTAGTLADDPIFTFGPLDTADGPYLDPQTQTLTMGDYHGLMAMHTSAPAFAATDVGRHVRIFTQPAAWDVGSTYAVGDLVTGPSGAGGDWWQSLIGSNTGVTPGTSTTIAGVPTLAWAPAPTAGSWGWGKITVFTDNEHVNFQFDTTIPGMNLQAANGLVATVWQMGLFGAANPTCGTFYEGRLWLGGAVANRFDTTVSNGLTQGRAVFSPTDPFGNVLDNSGISLTFNSKKITQINWMVPDHDGVLMGRLSGETLVAASTLGDPITPTSIQEHENTTYGSVPDVDPCRAGFPIVFAQRFGRRVIECFGDTFSGKLAGLSINKNSKHMTTSGVAQLEYQEEVVPIIWTRMRNGMLAGCTYRRTSRFASSPPEMAGWHWHMHGGNRIFTNMCVVPGVNGLLDRLFTVTNDPPGPGVNPALPVNYFIEIMQPFFDEQQTLGQAWFCDQSPGIGPGTSGSDCGGGNASAFTPTGGKGADAAGITFGSTGLGPDMATVAPFPALDAAPTGQSPPAGGVLLLTPGNAVRFTGTDILSNLPKFPARAGSVDKTSMSISVWLGRADMSNYQNGALLASPALSSVEYNAANKATSGFIGGAPVVNADSNKLMFAYSVPAGASGSLGAFANYANPLAGGDNGWSHVMISAKSVTGRMIVTIVIDESVIASSVDVGPVANASIWPFHTQPDALKLNGLCQWALGGRNTSDIEFVYNEKLEPHTIDFTRPPMFTFLSDVPAGKKLAMGYNANGTQILPSPTQDQIWQLLFSGGTYRVNSDIVSTSETGGLGNVPYPSPTSGVSGFIGNVAELWVLPGVFVDWTDSANRNKFHEQDPINTTTYGPISLGKNGSKPGLGTPWLYLSGDPSNFPLNRVNGKYLNVLSTATQFPGLSESDITFPKG